MLSGTGAPLQADMSGDHGAVAPSYVNATKAVRSTTTANTATGRRLGARSPRFEINGTAKRPRISKSGNTRMMKVSAQAGLRDNSPNSQRNGHSGRGLAPPNVGSGGAVGPLGPTSAAIATTTTTTRAEKNTSFRIASRRNGTPVSNSRSYSAS